MSWPNADRPLMIHLKPTNGQVYNIPNLNQNITLSLEHDATVNSLTLNFPPGFEGCEIKLLVNRAVTNLTMGGNIMSPPGNLQVGDTRIFTCPITNSSTWM